MSDAEPVTPSYSVSFRLQRATTETTFVSVPVTDDLMIPRPDGSGRIDVAKMVARAIEIGSRVGVVWDAESQKVQPHPIQIPRPGMVPAKS